MGIGDKLQQLISQKILMLMSFLFKQKFPLALFTVSLKEITLKLILIF